MANCWDVHSMNKGIPLIHEGCGERNLKWIRMDHGKRSGGFIPLVAIE